MCVTPTNNTVDLRGRYACHAAKTRCGGSHIVPLPFENDNYTKYHLLSGYCLEVGMNLLIMTF